MGNRLGKIRKTGRPSCTLEELQDIITAPCNGMALLPSRDLDEVYPNLYVGDASSAKNRYLLQRMGISHVLNAAVGTTPYHVNINPQMYKKVGIEYLGIEATDIMNYQLKKHFEKTSDYIDHALSAGGKVLVHCREGISRSATLVVAFLMIKRHLTAQAALRQVRNYREICPNDGFLIQLCEVNEKLTKSGHFETNS